MPALTQPVPPSAETLASLLSTLTDGVMLLDRDWRILYANDAARAISQVQPEYLLSKPIWEHYPAIVGSTFYDTAQAVMKTREPRNIDFYYEPLNHWVHVQILPVPEGIAFYYRDITRLLRAEQDRDATTRQLAQVLDATSDAVLMLDRDYKFTFANRQARQLLSPSGNLIGKHVWTEFPDAVYPGSPYTHFYEQAMEKRIPGQFDAYYPAPLNIWLSIQVQPADNGIIAFFRDITSHRADADALREQAELLRRKTVEAERQAAEIEALYQTAPIGLAYFDPIEFRYLRLNDRQAAFFGMPKEQILGRTLTEMAPIPGLHELFVQTREGTPVINYPLEGELVSQPGVHRYWTVNYFPVYAPDGTVQGITAASLEVTAQKKTEAALIESEKLAAVGRLASSISHEINNPLESVTNLLYLVSSTEGLTDEVKDWVETAQAELMRVSHIATETLRFHRQATSPSLITAEQLVGSVINLYQGRLLNSGIQVEARYNSTSQILCFENNIRQVLNNLIANAIDAMRARGGLLLLRAHDTIDWATGQAGVRIAVADTGHGIPPAIQSRLFEAFFTTKELNGTGLGLWISADIVRQHNGRLTFRTSQHAAHHGTVFSLFLPHKPNFEPKSV